MTTDSLAGAIRALADYTDMPAEVDLLRRAADALERYEAEIKARNCLDESSKREFDRLRSELADREHAGDLWMIEADRLRTRCKELEAKALPIVSHHCRTTHSACDCVLKTMGSLMARAERYEGALREISGLPHAHCAPAPGIAFAALSPEREA